VFGKPDSRIAGKLRVWKVRKLDGWTSRESDAQLSDFLHSRKVDVIDGSRIFS
jgi:hypothetical protein